MIEWITNIDMQVLLFIQEHLRNSITDPIMSVITTLGDGGILWILTSIIMLFFKPTRKIGICGLLAIALGFVVNNLILKNLFERVRPYDQFSQLIPIVTKPTDFSFPSGHTCSSFATSLTFYHFLKEKKKAIGVCAVILAILIAFSRLYVGVHFPTDVIVGMLIGIASSIIVCKFADKHDNLFNLKFKQAT